MTRASRFFNDDQRLAIEQAVADAESRTCAEIVPVIATASGRYDRAEDIVGLWVAAVLVASTWYLFREAPTESDWGIAWGQYELPALVAAIPAGFMAGVVAATRLAWLRRLFAPRAQMRAETNLTARQAFVDWRVHRTATGAGLLVYISLFERMTVILADGTVLDALGQERIERLCADLTPVLRSADPGEGFCQFLRQLGDELAEKLPRAETDTNELPNRLVVFD